MTPRQTRPFQWPRRWLMTDERMGDELFHAIARLPRGSGVIFRHHQTYANERARIGRSVARSCRRRGLLFAVSRDVSLARRLGARLVHNPATSPGLTPHSSSVHDEREAARAKLEGASLVFISPIRETSSHSDGLPLGIERAACLANASGAPAVALGGMDESYLARVRRYGFAGYAGIDCWIRT